MRHCNASEAAHRTPPGSSALRESEASAAKRSVGTEINPRYGEIPFTCLYSSKSHVLCLAIV
ncbi:hypothetical protein [Lysinibacillus sp. NPDC056232]|uniref:hypothetical protein n=1 Tax=Lysinibacillus sp. NPDC056232 TaxID=3345756 RepID=UPI0035DAB4D6